MGRSIYFEVFGIPRPQGSKLAFARSGKVWMRESAGDGLRTWRQHVYSAVVEVANGQPPYDGPVHLDVRFYLPRPKRPKWPRPASRPDLSKLIRALEDELTGTLLSDDARIVSVSATKEWSDVEHAPGARVRVVMLDDE